MQVPARRGASLVSVQADAVESPAAAAARGSEGGEGLADPVVLRFLEVVGQDSLLMLQLLEEESADHETRGRWKENPPYTVFTLLNVLMLPYYFFIIIIIIINILAIKKGYYRMVFIMHLLVSISRKYFFNGDKSKKNFVYYIVRKKTVQCERMDALRPQ